LLGDIGIISYEHIVLVSTLPHEVASLVPVYRERGNAENPFDELKNQWGWAGLFCSEFSRDLSNQNLKTPACQLRQGGDGRQPRFFQLPNLV
jgi:hypothetical protein